jgi:ParB family transcriptional regulator, chromosome partitioning protein
MPRKTGLGKGLSALIPDTLVEWKDERHTNAPKVQAGLAEIPVNAITPNPHQPRSVMDEAALRELADSIREHGLIQPLIVTQAANGYQIIAGERRWRAAQLAGLTTVPVVVKEAAPQQMLELALVENLQRADLNVLEEAAAFKQLMDEFGLTQDQVARRVGKSRAAVGNAVRLLKLPQPVKARLADGAITEGHARALMSLENEALMLKALAAVTRNAMSVRQTEEMVRRSLAGPKAKAKKAALSAETRAVEDRFRRALGTKVNLFKSRKGGKVVIHFYSDEEFDAIYRRIIGKD